MSVLRDCTARFARHNSIIRKSSQIILPHIPIPPSCNKISAEFLIAKVQVLSRQIRHKEKRDQTPNNPTNSSNDERPPLPQLILNRLKRLRPNRRPSFPNSSRQSVARPPHIGSIRLRREQTEHIPRAEVARALHQPVEDDEEGHDLGDAVVGAADYQPEDEVPAEADHHDFLAADAVAEEGAEEDAWEGDCAEEELPFACLEDCAVVDDGGDDCAGEDAVWEGDEVCCS